MFSRVVEGATVTFFGLARKFFSVPRISLTTPHLVYILVDSTKYRHFWFKVLKRFIKKRTVLSWM
jgi:hypothetical protein